MRLGLRHFFGFETGRLEVLTGGRAKNGKFLGTAETTEKNTKHFVVIRFIKTTL
jgi:hypothetical protein